MKKVTTTNVNFFYFGCDMFQFNFEYFYNIVLSDKKRVSLFNLLFHIRPENQSASAPCSGVKPPYRSHWQNINSPGGCDGLIRAAT